MKKNHWILSLCLLAGIWAFLIFFTLSWDLPGKYTPETDGITPQLSLSAKEMMKFDTYKYPPLQYLIADLVTENIPEKSLSMEELEAKRTERIVIYRMLSALMGLGTAVFLFFAGIIFLHVPPFHSLAASTFFLLLSPVLFYSQSSNMDMPACFWFVGSIFFAALAEYKFRGKERKKAYYMTHLLAGIFIACAFCTKDQVYALYILPAIVFCFRKWKETHTFKQVFAICLLWGAIFLITCTFIYFLIGFEVVLPHFNWIMGEGSSPYAATGKGIMERGKLLCYSLRDLGKAMDLPLLTAFLLFAFAVYKRKEVYKKDMIFIYLAALAFLFSLSRFLFFCQVVRYSQVRYFLPELPFFILLMLYIFRKETIENKNRKYIFILTIFLFIFQCAIAVNFLYILDHSPLARLKKELELSRLYEKYRIYTAMAAIGERYLQKKDGSMEKRICIRSWGTFLGLEKYKIRDIFPDDLSLFLLDPHFLISNRLLSFSEDPSGIFLKKYDKTSRIIFSLYDHTDKESFYLYGKGEKGYFMTFPSAGKGFQNDPLEIQIIKLNYLLPLHKNFTFSKMNLIGKALSPFTAPDRTKYLIHDYMYRILFDAYQASGRKEDAEKCRKFYQSIR